MSIDSLGFSNLDFELTIYQTNNSKLILIETLKLDTNLTTEHINLNENENYEFHLKTKVNIENIILIVHDEYYELYNKIYNDNLYIYTWKNFKNKLYINSIGMSDISFEINNNLIYYFPKLINIRSRKIDIPTVEFMLKYIDEFSDSLYLSASERTFIKLKSENKLNSKIQLVKNIKNCLDIILQVIPNIINNPIKNLKIINEEVNYKPEIKITQNSLINIIHNLERLEKTNILSDLKIGYNFYNLKSVITESLIDNYNIYENNIIIAFIEYLINLSNNLLDDIKSDISILKKKKEINKFEDIKFDFTIKKLNYFDNLISDCINNFYYIKKTLKDKFKLNEKIEFIPKLTDKIKNNNNYLKIFTLMNYFKVNNSFNNSIGFENITNIKSIDILFEIYVLFNIIDILLTKGFKLENPEISEVELNFFNTKKIIEKMSFKKDSYFITLYYNLKIWGFEKSDFISVALTSKQPDFILKINKNNKDYIHVFDAKYTIDKDTLKERLEDVIIKYYHGIRYKKNNFIDSIHIIHPTQINTSGYQSIYHKNFSILGDNRISPAIGIIPIKINEGNNDEFKYLLNNIIDI